ncbi:MAG: hypothetical protein ACFCVK_25945 [Acidimicrobiales bacterium]
MNGGSADGLTTTWQRLDFPTRAGVVATVLAVLGVLIPPIGVTSGVVAIVFSAVAAYRARGSRRSNPVAKICLAVSAGLIVLVVAGNAIYAARA